MMTLIVLNEVGLLRHEAHTDIEVEVLTHHTQHEFNIMCIVFVFGVSAQVVVKIALDGLIGSQVGIPRAIFRCPDRTHGLVAEVVGAAITLRIVVTVLITELEIDLTEDGLAIGNAGTVVPVLGGGVVIATGDVAGVVS